jgi:Txe/YoeB family toxin of Txe-Axe toxin-antitoxin module
MNNNQRPVSVVFADEKLKEAYYTVKDSDPTLFKFLDRATDEIKTNPKCGIPIPKRLIPKVYIQKYSINNLWKYNLPNAWRLVYSITGNNVEIIAILLEWFPHKEYERRFKY